MPIYFCRVYFYSSQVLKGLKGTKLVTPLLFKQAAKCVYEHLSANLPILLPRG